MANVPGSTGIIRYVETWNTDNIATGTATANGSAADGVAYLCSMDSGDTGFVRATNAARGMHCTGATDTTDNDMIEICGDTLMFYGQTGHSAVEALVQFDDVTNLAFNFGFNDDVDDAGNTLPIELSSSTWTTTASTAIMIVYDVDATNDELYCMWLDDDVDSTTAIADLRMTGIAPTNSQWLWMRVAMQDLGSSANGVRATFSAATHDGKTCTKTFNTNVDRDCALCLYYGIENRSGSAHNTYIKYFAWEQGIG